MTTEFQTELQTPTWQLGAPPASYVIGNVRVVLADRVTDAASVAVVDGRIAELVERGSLRCDVDGGGFLLAPGFIDTHSDSLEKERTPRPSVHLPLDFALGSFESRLAGVGITTIFHGLGFHNNSSQGIRRDPMLANDMSSFIDRYRGRRVDHRVLHRFNVRAEDGAEVLRKRIDGLGESQLPVQLSHEDHTPGQGQYADIQRHIEYLIAAGADREEATRKVQQRIDEAKHTEHVRDANLVWAGELARSGKARLLGHDCDSPEAIDALVDRGGAVAEFPTTIEAARRARERGLLIVAGAPNLLRGGSHSGNVSAAELLREGLIDAVSSDYLAAALLGSVSRIVKEGLLTLPDAIKLITAGGAAVGGLPDRGRIEPGLLADFALIDDSGAWPTVISTFKAITE